MNSQIFFCFCRYLPSTITFMKAIKATFQFETEGNGQNKIFAYMDRSEVKF